MGLDVLWVIIAVPSAYFDIPPEIRMKGGLRQIRGNSFANGEGAYVHCTSI